MRPKELRHKKYLDFVNDDIRNCTIALHDAKLERESYYDSLTQLQNKFKLLPKGALYEYDPTKENQFAYRYSFNVHIRKLFPATSPEIRFFRVHAKKYIEAFILEQESILKLRYLESFKAKLTFPVFRTIIKGIGQRTLTHLLKGDYVSFGNGMGSMEIIQKTLLDYNPVDWDKSIKTKKALLAEGVALWDKETDEGEKWMVFHGNTNCWYEWHRYKKDPIIGKQVRLYTFIPTCFVNTEFRLKEPYLATNPTEDEIIANNKLGSVEKLQYLLTQDPTIAFRFKKYDETLQQ